MAVTTIDGITHEHPNCKAIERGEWLHVTAFGKWVASYLRCAVRCVHNNEKSSRDILRDMFGGAF